MRPLPHPSHYLVVALLLAGTLFVSCRAPTTTAPAVTDAQATLVLDLPALYAQQPEALRCGACSFRRVELADGPAIAVTTADEFSDLFVDLAAATGGERDLTQVASIAFDLLVPPGSAIAAMKFNARDTRGNFGGVPEAANGFWRPSLSGETPEAAHSASDWQTIRAPFDSLRAHFENWEGSDTPLPRARELSFNPYNVNQRDSSTYYVRRLWLGDDVPAHSRRALVPRPPRVANVPYLITFDDEAWLRQQTAYRTFEGSNQVMARGVAGNPTRSIRLKGKTANRHIAFLPQIDKMTGAPADFSEVTAITFRYYLVPGGDPVDGASLFVVSEAWGDVLLDTLAVPAFEAGAWREHRIDLDALALRLVRGEAAPADVLAAVHELRLDLNYREGRKDVELWIDDFGWE